ncbi:hypothetical protein ACFWZ0_28260 [[Kitasatospora] papulosa]|uniref:hypothetical protein n=1 Tax=[Kitasatospora] papulosa TaxID=1464011 RepID=UPI0036A7DC70
MDLPLPLAPATARISPSRSSRDAPRNASVLPYDFLSPCAEISADDSGEGRGSRVLMLR